jgi:hypothetical protein
LHTLVISTFLFYTPTAISYLKAATRSIERDLAELSLDSLLIFIKSVRETRERRPFLYSEMKSECVLPSRSCEIRRWF